MKQRESVLSHELLTKVLDYNPDTGVFLWKAPLSNRAKKGAIAGNLDHHGHRLIPVNGIRYSAHRLAWFYIYKVWPTDEIDHENLLKDDNRISNLREATHQQNVRNVARKKHNKTGFKGVIVHPAYRDKKYKKYVAQITINGIPNYLGIFDTPEEAHAAYVRASLQHHKEFGRSK